MKRIFQYSLIFFFLFLLGIGSIHAQDFTLYSKYAILYNLDNGTVLYEQNSEEETSIASLTKIMTTLVAIEHIPSLDDTVTLTPDVFYGLVEANASVAGFRVGQTVTYLDLLYGVMLPSGADATRALAINLAGSEENFVVWMNEKAQSLGLTHTHYVNTSGLDTPNHYSTVYDVSVILKEALKNETFKLLYTTNKYTTSDGQITMRSTISKYQEKFQMPLPYIKGAKTGFTDNAGYCLASIAEKGDVTYLLVTAGSDHESKQPLHIIDAKTVYEYYFDHYENYPIIKIGDNLKTVNVKYSDITSLDIKAEQTMTKYLEKDIIQGLEYRYEGKEEIDYKVKQGEKIGTLSIYYQDAIIDKVDVILPISISFSLPAFLKANAWIWIGILILMIGGVILVKSRKS